MVQMRPLRARHEPGSGAFFIDLKVATFSLQHGLWPLTFIEPHLLPLAPKHTRHESFSFL